MCKFILFLKQSHSFFYTLYLVILFSIVPRISMSVQPFELFSSSFFKIHQGILLFGIMSSKQFPQWASMKSSLDFWSPYLSVGLSSSNLRLSKKSQIWRRILHSGCWESYNFFFLIWDILTMCLIKMRESRHHLSGGTLTCVPRGMYPPLCTEQPCGSSFLYESIFFC